MKGERYIVIEQLDTAFRVIEAVLDETACIRVFKENIVEEFPKVAKPRLPADNVILALDSKSATTVESKVTIPRSKPQDIISEGELDYLIFKGLWIFLNEHRNWAAKKMKVTDADVVLAGVTITRAALDENKVVNPLGFKGKRLMLRLRGTFIPRDALPLVYGARRLGRRVIAVECLGAVSLTLRADFMVYCGELSTSIFFVNKDETKFKERILWGLQGVTKPIAHELAVDITTASHIAARYLMGKVSKQMEQFLGKLTEKPFRNLQTIVKGISRKGNPNVYVNVPELVFRATLSRLKKVKRMDFEDIVKHRGFDVIITTEREPLSVEPNYLVLIGGELFSEHYDLLNKMLQRRSRWLMPHV